MLNIGYGGTRVPPTKKFHATAVGVVSGAIVVVLAIVVCVTFRQRYQELALRRQVIKQDQRHSVEGHELTANLLGSIATVRTANSTSSLQPPRLAVRLPGNASNCVSPATSSSFDRHDTRRLDKVFRGPGAIVRRTSSFMRDTGCHIQVAPHSSANCKGQRRANGNGDVAGGSSSASSTLVRAATSAALYTDCTEPSASVLSHYSFSVPLGISSCQGTDDDEEEDDDDVVIPFSSWGSYSHKSAAFYCDGLGPHPDVVRETRNPLSPVLLRHPHRQPQQQRHQPQRTLEFTAQTVSRPNRQRQQILSEEVIAVEWHPITVDGVTTFPVNPAAVVGVLKGDSSTLAAETRSKVTAAKSFDGMAFGELTGSSRYRGNAPLEIINYDDVDDFRTCDKRRSKSSTTFRPVMSGSSSFDNVAKPTNVFKANNRRRNFDGSSSSTAVGTRSTRESAGRQKGRSSCRDEGEGDWDSKSRFCSGSSTTCKGPALQSQSGNNQQFTLRSPEIFYTRPNKGSIHHVV